MKFDHHRRSRWRESTLWFWTITYRVLSDL